MNRLILAFRCFFAVLFYLRLPPEALALLPPPQDLGRLPEPEPVPQKEAEIRPEPVSPPAPEPKTAPALASVEAAAEPAPPMANLDEARQRGAIQMLSILQREGRLIDFLMEEVDAYADAQIGAAVRDIHRGCRKGLIEHLKVSPIRPEPDEAAVRVEDGYDPSKVRLIGNITGRPPFHGTLRHHGWRAQRIVLPALPASHDPLVITPAEVELGG